MSEQDASASSPPRKRASKSLWEHYFGLIRPHGVTAEPWGRDRVRVEALLVELYRLGERPSRREVADYLNSQGDEGASLHRKTVLDLWSKRLAQPHRQWRTKEAGYPWRYPFYFADTYVEEQGIESVGDRLARQVSVAAAAHAEAVSREPGGDETEATEDELRAATHALIVWGHVRDRADDDWWLGGLLLRRNPADRRNRATKRGRRLHAEWLARIRKELEDTG